MAKTFLEMLATLPQTPKHFPWDLRDSRKRQKVFRETCNGVANAKKFFVRLATVLQAFPKALWPLQRAIQDILYGLDPHSFVELTLRKGRSRVGVGSPQVGEKPEGWCGIDAVALAAAEAVIANFRP